MSRFDLRKKADGGGGLARAKDFAGLQRGRVQCGQERFSLAVRQNEAV